MLYGGSGNSIKDGDMSGGGVGGGDW